MDVLVLDSKNKKKSMIWSIILHLLLLLLFFLPYFEHQDPPPEIYGVVVNFGKEVFEKKAESTETPIKGEPKAAPSKQQTKPKAQTQKESTPPKPTEKKVEKTNEVKARIIDEESIIKATQESVEKTKAAEAAAEEAKKRARAEEQARREKLKRQEEAKKYEESKNKFGSLFGKSDGTVTESSKGNPDGIPDQEKLEGLVTGVNNIEGGLKGRGVLYVPTIKDDSQKTGKVVVKVCVNDRGDVISSKFTQRGSTTTDRELINIAEKGASKYKFTPSSTDRQCGSIMIEFKVK